MKKTLFFFITFLISISIFAQNEERDKFISNLMQKMTPEEKLGQLNLDVAGDIVTGNTRDSECAERIMKGQLGGVFNIKGAKAIRNLQNLAVKKSRLGIPLMVGMDVIHGYETIFPIPLASSCSWDLKGIERMARISATEASADGIMWTFSPMTDICLDARWGRIAEGSGEDPYLGSEIARAMVRGYQGNLTQPNQIAACLKHFALYGAVEAGRDYNTVDMSRLRMFNQYLPPYKAAIEEGVLSVMPSFNVVDGIPATANKWLLTDVLRNKWGFKGFTVSDYTAILEMVTHGAGNLETCSRRAILAGTDIDMCTGGYLKELINSMDTKVLEAVNNACRRVLEAKWALGLFANPYKYCDEKRAKKEIFTAENRRIARDFAAETFVLLKNKDNVLPLKKEGNIALIGPLANNRANMVGTWTVAARTEDYSTLKESMEKTANGKAKILYAQGCNVVADSLMQNDIEFGKSINRVNAKEAEAQAISIAKEADVIVCAMGECAEMSGESSCRASLNLPEEQMNLLKKLRELNKPIVLLNFSGRPTVMTWESENIDAIMNVWFGGSEAADAICDVLFGDKCPSGKLTATMPQHLGQVPIYYNYLNTGRPVGENAKKYQKYRSNYFEVRNDPLYPFGYGLSYTSFSYSQPAIENNKVSFIIKNTGDREGAEIAQLYIRDLEATIMRPVKELKAFKRVNLKPGEEATIEFTITKEMLSYYDAEGNLVFEPGKFKIMIGPNSKDVKEIEKEFK